MRRTRLLASAGLLAVAATALADAPASPSPYRDRDHASIISVQWENDVLASRGTDRHYTNGLRVSWLRADDRLPGWMLRVARALPWFPDGGLARGSWAVGQNLYTPEDIKTDALVPDDRPYASWLYLGRGLTLENGRILDIVELSLGMVGPAALGEPMHETIHDIIDSPAPRGWDNQLKNEPALQLIWQRKWRRLHDDLARGLSVDVLPHVGGALGNVFIHGSAGGTIRLGLDLPADYGPPRIQPALPGSEFFVPRRRFGGYLFLGGEVRATLRNLFLDGNTFVASHRVDRRLLVADMQAGLAIQGWGMRLAFTYVVRTEEFDAQDGLDAFGVLTLSLRS